jgi:hypothetical protein
MWIYFTVIILNMGGRILGMAAWVPVIAGLNK